MNFKEFNEESVFVFNYLVFEKETAYCINQQLYAEEFIL